MVMSSCVYANVEAFKSTDPEFAAFFGAFAYDEVVKESKLDSRTRYLAIIATLPGCQGTAYLDLGRTFPFIEAANDVLESRGVSLPPASTTTPDDRVENGNAAQVEIFGEEMRGFQNGGTINRWLAGNCFGNYYTRKGLTLREHEINIGNAITYINKEVE